MQRASAALARLVVRGPGAVLLGALALSVAATPLALRVRHLDTDPLDLLPRAVPEAATFARYSRLFGGEQLLLVLVESSDPARLASFADAYAAALRARPDVQEVRERLSGETAARLRDHLLDLLDDEEIDALAAKATPE